MTPRAVEFPDVGAFRIARDPGRLPRGHDVLGGNRFDDPRPKTLDRFTVRYCARTVRGCLLELLDQFRPDPVARGLEASVTGLPLEPKAASDGQALTEYLAMLNVGRVIARSTLTIVSVHDADVQAWLNREPGVRALLDSPKGRTALLPAGAGATRRPHLDGAVVRLSTAFGRDVTRACSLALYDRTHRCPAFTTGVATMTPRSAGRCTTGRQWT